MAKHSSSKRPAHSPTEPHRHKSGRCLRILRALSAFIDDELPRDVCSEIRRHLGACPRCEDFVVSLRQTVSLCRRIPAPVLTAYDRARMRERILSAAGRR
ncbi:anti-sigma factor family protein [Candidatus Nitrospira inopinata]|uniref:anti-sigma factor family protein n=1 Tax=Candidatus Nitrospira inopinata TaxID=1715989 RepID=UPI000784D3F5